MKKNLFIQSDKIRAASRKIRNFLQSLEFVSIIHLFHESIHSIYTSIDALFESLQIFFFKYMYVCMYVCMYGRKK